MTKQVEVYLTISEAAATIERSAPVVWKMIRERRIPTYKKALDRRTYILAEDLERAVREFVPRERRQGAPREGHQHESSSAS